MRVGRTSVPVSAPAARGVLIRRDESRLELYVEDPEIFTTPMSFDRYWAWKPAIALEPFGCEQ